MFIAIHAPGMAFNGATIAEGKSLGGSESAAYYVAKELAVLGHKVTVFTNEREGGEFDDVRYQWVGNQTQQFPMGDIFHHNMMTPYDALIMQRHPQAFVHPYNSKVNMWWLHDLALRRNAGAVQPHLLNIDHVLCVSDWHRQQVAEIYQIDPEFITATKNGVDYSQFEGLHSLPKIKNSLVYAARPERGLENLVGDDDCIMSRLPDHHLYVCGYDNTVPQMREFYNYLWARCEELPNVTNLGSLGKAELYRLLAKSELYVYPTEFEDTSCIMALEANAAGTPFITSNIAALPETTSDGGFQFVDLDDGKVNKDDFADAIRDLTDDPNTMAIRREQSLSKRQPWSLIAEQWQGLIENTLREKSSNPYRLHKHLEHNSDIVISEWAGGVEQNPSLLDNYKFYFEDDFQGHYERYYQYEKERGVEYGPEPLSDVPGQPGFNPRYKAICMFIEKYQPKRILDYGCAHGHYVINLLQRFDFIEYITGIDLDQSNVNSADSWVASSGINSSRALFIHGDAETLDPDIERYDLVMANEVIEHVADPHDLVSKLAEFVAPEGSMIVSTPYGPWEAIGYEQHPGWRAHLHHFERPDLHEMFGEMKDFELLAVPAFENFENYGNFVASFKPDKPFGKIDYERKSNQQAPQETLSVCIIAKDAEFTLGQTLQSIESIADEIIVGIDEGTTDQTIEVAEKFGAVHFPIRSPLDQGFDAARNETIKRASMDWIMWIDADETMENEAGVKKYLRNNCFDGYGIPQHHFSVEPAGILQTDYPIRLFRNHKDIKFFGVVHEHPETEINKGVGKALLVHDIHHMHTGYSTEPIRRARFKRNEPLMERDREKYPERNLGRYLWVRDVAHKLRYMAETRSFNGNIELVREIAEASLEDFRELVERGEVRLVKTALQYYSEVCQWLYGEKAIEYAVNMATSWATGAPPELNPNPVKGIFANREDIEAMLKMFMDEATKPWTEQYW